MAARAFSELLEIALVLVRFDHVASRIVNGNHCVLCDTRNLHSVYERKIREEKGRNVPWWDSCRPRALSLPRPNLLGREVHGGATVFIPANTWVSVNNIGSDPIGLIYIFS